MGRLRKLIPRYSLRTLVVFLLLVTSAGWLWWHWEAWVPLVALAEPRGNVKCAAVSGDGKLLFAVYDTRAFLYSLPEGRTIRSFAYGGEIESVSFSQDSKRILVRGPGGRVKWIFDGRTGEGVVDKIEGMSLNGRWHFSDDGRYMVLTWAGPDPCTKIYDTEARRLMASVENAAFGVWFARFDRGGKKILADCGAALDAVIVDGATGDRLAVLNDEGDLHYWGEFFPDGSMVLTSSRRGGERGVRSTVRVHDAQTGAVVADLAPHLPEPPRVGGVPRVTWEYVYGAAFLPETGRFVTFHDQAGVCVWNATTFEREVVILDEEGLENHRPVRPVVSPGGTRAITVGARVKLWDTKDGELIATLPDQQANYAPPIFDRRGERFLVCHQGAVGVWDSRTGASLAILKSQGPFVLSCALSRDEQLIAVCESGLHGDGKSRVDVYRRRRPEWWWGIFYLWEFWLTAVLAGVFVWSVWRDRRALRKREAA